MTQSYRNTRTGFLTDLLVDTTPIGAIVPNLKTGQNSYDHSFIKFNATNYPALTDTAGNAYQFGDDPAYTHDGYLYCDGSEHNIADYPVADFQLYSRALTGATDVTSAKVEAGTVAAGTYTLFVQETLKGDANLTSAITVSVVATGAATDADVIANAINAAGLTNVVASVDSGNRVKISHRIGGDVVVVDAGGLLNAIGITASGGTPTANFYSEGGDQYRISNWKPLVYTASDDAPTAIAANGALWYSSIIDEVDIMVHNGTTWVGYQDATAPYYANGTDPAGPIVSASEPTEQSDTSPLATGDIWISTADLENYPRVYVYNAILAAAGSNPWVEVDTTDQTTENGMLFADARYNTSGANSDEAGDITDLLTSNYLDPDAPDPALYPKGMLLWNLRRSGFNVKRFERNYIDVNGDNQRMGDASM